MAAGFDNSVSVVLEDLLTCLDDPALALLQWDEVFSVVQVQSTMQPKIVSIKFTILLPFCIPEVGTTFTKSQIVAMYQSYSKQCKALHSSCFHVLTHP